MTAALNPSNAWRTTGIGSLPHHNVDAALEVAFSTTIPFLPQIPIRNPWEYMIPQSLEGLPGLLAERDGSAVLDLNLWYARTKRFDETLTRALESNDFTPFEPAPSLSSTWTGFLWELEERKCKEAKIQIAGPLTAQWALRLSESHHPVQKRVDEIEGLSSQIVRLILVRALAMSKRLQASGIQPVLFLDEPALYVLNTEQHPRHLIAFQELRTLIQALRKSGARVGLHCCGNTDWSKILSLELDYLSLDTELSLTPLLATGDAVHNYVTRGGRFAFGVIPTSRSMSALHSISLPTLENDLKTALESCFGPKTDSILQESLFTPACGLAYHGVAEADRVFDLLNHLANRRKNK